MSEQTPKRVPSWLPPSIAGKAKCDCLMCLRPVQHTPRSQAAEEPPPMPREGEAA